MVHHFTVQNWSTVRSRASRRASQARRSASQACRTASEPPSRCSALRSSRSLRLPRECALSCPDGGQGLAARGNKTKWKRLARSVFHRRRCVSGFLDAFYVEPIICIQAHEYVHLHKNSAPNPFRYLLDLNIHSVRVVEVCIAVAFC